MKLRNLTENTTAALGATALKKTVGGAASGQMVAKGLDKVGQGQALNPQLIKALAPYASLLNDILSDPQFRSRFMVMVKQIHADKQQPAQAGQVTEDQDSVDAVAGAITRRIMMQHTDLLSKYGPVKVMAAIDDVADFAGSDGLDEIGSSDVSIWTKQVIQDLEAGHFDHMESVNEAEEDAVDTVSMDVPLLLRMLEYAREDAQEDVDLHTVTDKMIELSKEGTLTMDHYDSIVGETGTDIVPVEESQWGEPKDVLQGVLGTLEREVEWPLTDIMDPQEVKQLVSPLMQAISQKLNSMEESADTGLTLQQKAQAIFDYVIELPRDDMRDMGIQIGADGVGEAVDEWIDRLARRGELDAFYHEMLDNLDEGAESISENLGYGYNPVANTVDQTNVNYSQTKQMGDASVTVSANAKSMDELHRVLKLAGLDVDTAKSYPEPTVEPTPTQPAEEVPCGCNEPAVEPSYDNDVKYSTDKQTLINVLRDKLQKSIG